MRDIPVAMFSGGETGPAVLLPDGRALFFGYTHTAIYTPGADGGTGSWVAGPDIPNGENTGDVPATMMNNGKVLVMTATGYLKSVGGFYEYDPATNSFTTVSDPPSPYWNAFQCKMLNLPDGNVLFLSGGVYTSLYTPDTAPLVAGKPAISSVVRNSDGTYTLTGTGLTGITEGASYGDDAGMATNYPIVRLTSGTNVYYARTFNWSTTNVMTGSTPVTTQFTLPPELPAGTYSLVVTTNGNPSIQSLLPHPPPGMPLLPLPRLRSRLHPPLPA